MHFDYRQERTTHKISLEFSIEMAKKLVRWRLCQMITISWDFCSIFLENCSAVQHTDAKLRFVFIKFEIILAWKLKLFRSFFCWFLSIKFTFLSKLFSTLNWVLNQCAVYRVCNWHLDNASCQPKSQKLDLWSKNKVMRLFQFLCPRCWKRSIWP